MLPNPPREGVAICGRKYTELLEVQVVLHVDGEGDVTGVYLPRKYTGTPFEMCVTRAISDDADFPALGGGPQTAVEDFGIPP